MLRIIYPGLTGKVPPYHVWAGLPLSRQVPASASPCARVQDDAFEEVYKTQFIEFLAAVPPWFTLDINQGVLTLHLSASDPSAFAAEVYGAALGQAVADDFKYNFGHNVLQSALAVLRCKAQGRIDVDVRPCRHSGFPCMFWQATASIGSPGPLFV